MSGIGTIYHRDGRPVDAIMLERMMEAMNHRGPDGITQWVKGPVGLGHCLMRTTPESVKEHYPVSDAERWLVWDGRLDNRQELLSFLHSASIPCGARTDPELVMGAYRLWGMRCVEKMLGEFAFVLWDQRTSSLFVARDRLGIKPLYYCSQGSTLLIASEVKPLLRLLDRMPEPDDEMILAVLLAECREPDNGRSLFAGLHRLPPGHTMCVSDGTCEITRYWRIDPAKQTVYKQPGAYVEHFLALFEEAVRCRTRSAFPVGCFLSGGLDSSAITAMAAKQGAVVEAFTVFSGNPASDEWSFARQVCGALGIPLWEVPDTNPDPLDGLGEQVWELESPDVSHDRTDSAFNELVRSRNCRIVLNGVGGDQLLDELGYLADLLARARPLRFIRETRQFAQWYGAPFGEFVKEAFKGALPPPLKSLGKRIFRGMPPSWVNADLARSVNLAGRVCQPRVPMAFPCLSQTLSYEDALSPYFLLKLEVEDRAAAHAGREIRFPFLDSRLVEFVLSIPWDQRCHLGERKWLLRQAMQGMLPEAVRLRKGKGDWSNEMDQALLSLCRLGPPEPLANRSGMMERHVNLRGAGELVQQYLKGKRSMRMEVWLLVALDHWLKRFWKGGEEHVADATVHQEAVRLAEAALVR